MNWFNKPLSLPDHEWLRALVPVLRQALLNPEPVVARILEIADDIEPNGGCMTPDKETLDRWAKRVASCRLFYGMSAWDRDAHRDLAEAAEFLRTHTSEPSQPAPAESDADAEYLWLLGQRGHAIADRIEKMEVELQAKTCPRCDLDGYWYHATAIANERINKLEAENARLAALLANIKEQTK